MKRRTFAFVGGCVWAASCGPGLLERAQGSSDGVRLPVSRDASSDASHLIVHDGAADALPAGPGAFDVLANGEFAIADPLRKRIAFFDAAGRYLRDWKLGFAVDALQDAGHGALLVRRAASSTWHRADGKSLSEASPEVVHKVDGVRIERGGGFIEVLPEKGERVVGVRVLGTTGDGDLFVQVESYRGWQKSIAPVRSIRKYDANGGYSVQTGALADEQYLVVDEDVRVRKDRIYQMVTTPKEILIRSWAVLRI